MLLSTLLVSLGCAACADRTPTAPPGPDGFSGGTARLLSTLTCQASPRGGTLTCSSADAGGVRAALYGSNQVKLTSSNVHYDSVAQNFGFDVNVKNLLTVTIGTTTGTDTVGLKAFFETGPVPTSFRSPGDTGTVSVKNADGTANFTGSSQPYFFYRTILKKDSVSANKHWDLHCPLTVLTFSFTVRVFTRTVGAPGVSAAVPDGYFITQDSLAALYAAGKRIEDSPRMSGSFPRAVVILAFNDAATADERQSALDLIGGRVFGGDGTFYYVVIKDDSTGATLWSSVDRLHALPQVKYAQPDVALNVTTFFQVPDDGSGWQRSDWQLAPERATGANWAPEAIGAPMAWGCESDGSGAHGAIVDFVPIHIQQVETLLSEPGNDRAGITGMVWNGSVTSYDGSRGGTAPDGNIVDNMTHDLEQAIRTSSVINLSWGAR